MTDIDPKLLQWASPTQRAWLESWADLGSSSAAAEAFGVGSSNVRQALARVRRKAARAGYPRPTADDQGAPPGQHERGRSVLRRANGEVVLWWDKSAKDRDSVEYMVMEALEGLADRMNGLSVIVPAPTDVEADLMAVYSMGDPHLGMRASAAKTGQNFDLATAKAELLGAIGLLVDRAPPAGEALMVNVGDMLHFDNPGKTTTRGTAQDADGELEEMVEVALDTMVAAVEMAKRKHATVRVIIAKGNHDKVLSYMLTVALRAYYRNDPRVIVTVNPGEFTYHLFGVNLVGVAHGENPRKVDDLEPIMVSDCDRNGLWAPGQHRVWYTGHLHHDRVRDFRNCTVRTLRTLAPGSNWSHGAGYRSIQEMKCDLYHRQYGKRGEVIAGIDEVRDFLLGAGNAAIPGK